MKKLQPHAQLTNLVVCAMGMHRKNVVAYVLYEVASHFESEKKHKDGNFQGHILHRKKNQWDILEKLNSSPVFCTLYFDKIWIQSMFAKRESNQFIGHCT